MTRYLHILLSFFSRTANIVAFVFLLLSILAAYINPDYFWPLALFGLAYPIILAVNIFFVVSWVFRRRWFFLLSFTGILLSYPQLQGQIATGAFWSDKHTKTDIRVLSYNVRSFDLYNWSKRSHSRKSMLDSIASVKADVICFQEFHSNPKNIDNEKTLKEMGYKYSVEAVELKQTDGHRWSVAIYSRLPIENSGTFLKQATFNQKGKPYHRGCFADVRVNDTLVRIMSVHLQSVHLDYHDYDVIKEVKDEQSGQKKDLLKIGVKLAKAFSKRGVQTMELLDFLDKSPYPVVLCGDFNDTPSSFAYQSVNGKLQDAFLKGGKGIGATYNGLVPFLRIDYIFTSRELRCRHMEINGNPESDHFPLVADILLK